MASGTGLPNNGATQLHHALLAAPSDDERLWPRITAESKKLWRIVGPAMVSRLTGYAMNVVTLAFAGHLGEVELAAISIANNVIVGFSFGLLLGAASALETLCGQAFGAKEYRMLGIYMQRSWIVMLFFCILLLPLYTFAGPILLLLGQTSAVAAQTEVAALCMIPLHFSFALVFPLQRFLQCQLRNNVIAIASAAALAVNALTCWLLVSVLDLGVIGAAVSLDVAWWFLMVVLYGYACGGWCPQTWMGFSVQAFSGLWEFLKLTVASGVMLCLENWYFRILILMTGYLKNSTIAVDALSICMTIMSWQFMIPLAFFAGTGVRVANELGSGNGKAAKFATKMAVCQSGIIGVLFFGFILVLHDKYAYMFTSSGSVLRETDRLSLLLALTILFNSVQPILSGVAVGCGWQAWVAYINLGCYYLIGLPLGFLMGWLFNLGVMGIWGGMIFGGTAIQTLILTLITLRCDWKLEAEKASLRVHNWTINDTQIQPPRL